MVKYKVVEFVVSVDQGTAVSGLSFRVHKVRNHLMKVWELAHTLSGIHVGDFSLHERQVVESLDLPFVEAVGSSKVGESDLPEIKSVELCQSPNSVLPPCCFN